MLRSTVEWFQQLAHQPLKVLWMCLAFAAVGVVLDGTAIRVWGLHREHGFITSRIAAAKVRAKSLEFRIQEAQQPQYIERAARDQFDFVKEGDLVFVFADDGEQAPEKSTQSRGT